MRAPELGEAEAIRSFFDAGTLAETATIGGAVCTASPLIPDAAKLNRAAGLGEDEAATREALEEIDAFFAARELAYCVTMTPHAQPPELRAWLDERGFAPAYAWQKFERDVSPAPPAATDLEVRRVGHDDADAFGRAFGEGYGLPPAVSDWCAALVGRDGWDCFVAFARDEPAASGALFVTGDIGWLGFGATRPAFQRRGAQNAILAARIERVRELECRVLVTETGELLDGRPSASFRNIVRAGFEPVYVRQNFVAT